MTARLETVVVIGSGPAGAIRGEDIDSHPVVRMHNHEWQPVERYGSRYDYGFITSLQDARDAHRASRRPAKSYFFYNVPSEPVVPEINGDRVLVWNHRPCFTRAVANGAEAAKKGRVVKFTRGFAAVAATMEYLRPKRVIVVGMDVLQNGLTGLKYYDHAALPWYVKRYPGMATRPEWANDEMPVGESRDGPHDFRVEASLIRELAAEAGIEIIWGAVARDVAA